MDKTVLCCSRLAYYIRSSTSEKNGIFSWKVPMQNVQDLGVHTTKSPTIAYIYLAGPSFCIGPCVLCYGSNRASHRRRASTRIRQTVEILDMQQCMLGESKVSIHKDVEKGVCLRASVNVRAGDVLLREVPLLSTSPAISKVIFRFFQHFLVVCALFRFDGF